MPIPQLLQKAFDTARRLPLSLIAATLLFVGLILVTEYVVGLREARAIDQYRSETLLKIATLRARLEGEINATLHLTHGLSAFVATHPDLTTQDFERLTAELLVTGKHIRNIGLAPGNVIRFMFPLAGNEKAIGLDYSKNAEQWPAVQRTIDTGATITAGPIDLVQGGRGFIIRTPIYVRPDPSEPGFHGPLDYWGLASIVMDIHSVYTHAGIQPRINGTDIAIRGKDGLGKQGEAFYGNSEVFNQDMISMDVTFPNGSWQLAAYPPGGWGVHHPFFGATRLAGWLLSALVATMFFLLLEARRINKKLALHDQLTGLPNRRLLQDRFFQAVAYAEREKQGFALFYFDLNNFKPINDRYGHRAGDMVLKEVASRLLSAVRATDTISRIGGDEFVVLAVGEDAENCTDRLRESLNGSLKPSMSIYGHPIQISASVGVSRFPSDGSTLEELLNQADRAMYKDKRGNIKLVKFAR